MMHSPGIGQFPTLANLWARYKASSLTGIADAGAVAQWDDISGFGHHATQATSARQPLKRNAAAGLTGNTAAVEFLGSDADPHSLNLPSMAAFTSGEVFVFLKNNTEAATRRLWELGNGPLDSYYKFVGFGVDGIYESFGCGGSRVPTGNPSAGALTSWHNYNASSAASVLLTFINNTGFFAGSNTTSFGSAPTIGGNVNGSSGTRLADKLIAEIVILISVATTAQRLAMYSYFRHEYLGL